jgi:hypothetical protein
MRKKPDDPMTNLGNSVQQTVEWATRIIAVCIFMGLIVWGGTRLDARLESKWFTPIGLVLGIAFGMAGMILVVKRMEIAMEDKNGAMVRRMATNAMQTRTPNPPRTLTRKPMTVQKPESLGNTKNSGRRIEFRYSILIYKLVEAGRYLPAANSKTKRF